MTTMASELEESSSEQVPSMQECEEAGSCVTDFFHKYYGKQIRQCDKDYLQWAPTTRKVINERPDWAIAAKKYHRYLDANPGKCTIGWGHTYFGRRIEEVDGIPYFDWFCYRPEVTLRKTFPEGWAAGKQWHEYGRNNPGHILTQPATPYTVIHATTSPLQEELEVQVKQDPLTVVPLVPNKTEHPDAVIETPRKKRKRESPGDKLDKSSDVDEATDQPPSTPRRSKRIAKRRLPETRQLPTPHPTPQRNAQGLRAPSED
ncbi:hypothetical protein CALCODRAFT_553747 [Calocera cornea HHB12733]|uniref:Uncharacterized protein n=1 Tax=Calocera cornea HHB12733 TaxID=1353952 RepID=A0A165I8Z3_9BASI|nr:hypothetical protein CALCODRAFT_553747 [Calocera cornea HHB12733]